MNGPELAAATKARLESQIPSRTTLSGAVPDGNLPARYLLVRTSEGSEDATRYTGTVSVQTPALWVLSVSRNTNPIVAEREAAWGAAEVRKALRNWRPDGAWPVRHDVSSPARRDESITATTFYAVEQFSLRSHI